MPAEQARRAYQASQSKKSGSSERSQTHCLPPTANCLVLLFFLDIDVFGIDDIIIG
jgi:hypothetical protein